MSLLAPLAAHAHPAWEEFGVGSWLLVALAAGAMVWSIWKAVRFTLEPGETEPHHIKRSILGEPVALHVAVGSSAPGEARSAAPEAGV